MSKQADEKALKAYPIKVEWVGNQYGGPEDINTTSRKRFQEGYEKAEQDLCWHSVEESLPPMDEEVIVLTNVINGRVLDTARYICFGHIVNKEICVDYDGWNIPGVKYWMPCPKLPED